MKIAVLSDIHYVSRRMTEKVSDREVLMKPSISERALEMASKEADVMLITGDLTDSGDKYSHDELVEILRRIKNNGTRVYVTTATHDFNHYKAYAQKYGSKIKYKSIPWHEPFFDTDKQKYSEIVEDEFASLPEKDLKPELAELYTAAELWDLYADFGRNDAVSVCDEAHSYCVALDKKTWAIMLNDNFRNNEQGNPSVTYSPACFRWIDSIVKKAKSEGVFVFACTHHPLVPPVPAYKLGGGVMNMRRAYVGHTLADIGIELVFTGHTHFSDIGFMRSDKGSLLCDITTPSVRFYPPEYRVAEIDGENGMIDVHSVAVSDVEGFELEDETLREHFRKMFYNEYVEKVAKLPSPFNSVVEKMRVKHLYPLCRHAAGMNATEYEQIKDMRMFDIIIGMVLNMLGGDGEFTPDTPVYKFVMGLSAVLDSIIEVQPFYDVRKKLLGGYTVSEIFEPMLFNNEVGDREACFNFREEPKKRFDTPHFSSNAGDIVMTALSILVIPLAKLAPAVCVASLPVATLLKKNSRKKNPLRPERY